MKSNRESNYRYRHSWIDFQQDGMSPHERIKGKDKRYLRKKSQKRVRKDLEKDWGDEEC